MSFKKNTQRLIVFPMLGDISGVVLQTGATVTAQVSKDGAGFGNSTNAVAELSNGFYKLTLTATEMNADVVVVRASATDCAQQNLIFYTEEYLNSDVKTVADGIKTQTDQFVFTTANKVNARVDYVGANAVTTPNDMKADVSALGLEATLSDIKGTGFAKDSHSLPQCISATGFATLNPPSQVLADYKASGFATLNPPSQVLADYKASGFATLNPPSQVLADYKASGFATLNPPSQDLADYKASGFSTHSAADIWTSLTRSLTDKAGFSLSTAGIKAIWDQATSALSTAGSLGKLLVDNINATISSRSSHAASAIWSVVSRALTDKAGFSLAAGQEVQLNVQGKTDINAEIDSALDTAIPASPTDDSINERIKTIDEGSGGGLTSDEVATAVLDATLSDHTTGASVGEKLDMIRARTPVYWSKDGVEEVLENVKKILNSIQKANKQHLEAAKQSKETIRLSAVSSKSSIEQLSANYAKLPSRLDDFIKSSNTMGKRLNDIFKRFEALSSSIKDYSDAINTRINGISIPEPISHHDELEAMRIQVGSLSGALNELRSSIPDNSKLTEPLEKLQQAILDLHGFILKTSISSLPTEVLEELQDGEPDQDGTGEEKARAREG